MAFPAVTVRVWTAVAPTASSGLNPVSPRRPCESHRYARADDSQSSWVAASTCSGGIGWFVFGGGRTADGARGPRAFTKVGLGGRSLAVSVW